MFSAEMNSSGIDDPEQEPSFTDETFQEEEYLVDVDGTDGEDANIDTGGIDYDPFGDEESPDEEPEPSASSTQVVNRSKKKRTRTNSIETLFAFKGVYCQRLFRNQLRPREHSTKEITGNTVEEVVKSLWESGEHLIKRRVIYEDDVPKWSSEGKPSFEDAADFITLQDLKLKKVYTPDNLTLKLLQKWRGSSIKVFVYAYSTAVETSAQYQEVLKKLISPSRPDRAGANSTRDEAQLAHELRCKHPHLEGHSSSWQIWASLINGVEPHEQETMKNDPSPPIEIAKYFRWVGVSEAARLDSIHRGMVVANAVNDRWSRQVKEIKQDLSTALAVIQGALQKIDILEAETNVSTELISAMGSAVQPEEKEISRHLASKISDCPDVDHM